MKPAPKGFTIVEMLAAILSASVLAITVSITLAASYRAWRDNNKYLDLQRETSLARAVGDKWIREASSWEVSATNNILTIASSNVTQRLSRSGNTLVFDPNVLAPGNELVICSNRVESFAVQRTPFGVRIDLSLRDGDMVSGLHTFLSYRN